VPTRVTLDDERQESPETEPDLVAAVHRLVRGAAL
jgi:hypothetical protein